jgi:hypothetical protein
MKLHELHEAVSRSVADLKIEYAGGNFSCSSNSLTSLEGSPSEVSGYFYCTRNSLTSLVGAPSDVSGGFYCLNNKLTSLEGAPSKVGGNFYCDYNKLISLEGAPSKVGGNFSCDNNKLTSLEGAPSKVGGYFSFVHSKLTSLEGIHLRIKHIGGQANFERNPIKSHVLGLLLIDGLKKISLDNTEVEKIINKYLRGDRDVFECQNELMDAGLDEYAQL